MKLFAEVTVMVLVIAACTGSTTQRTEVPPPPATEFRVRTTALVIELTPRRDCFNFVGTGELEGVDLFVYCTMGRDLIRAVDSCERRCERPDVCLDWATSPESEGGAGLTGLNEAELDLAFRLGRIRINMEDASDREFDFCVAIHGEELCRDAYIGNHSSEPIPYP